MSDFAFNPNKKLPSWDNVMQGKYDKNDYCYPWEAFHPHWKRLQGRNAERLQLPKSAEERARFAVAEVFAVKAACKSNWLDWVAEYWSCVVDSEANGHNGQAVKNDMANALLTHWIIESGALHQYLDYAQHISDVKP